MYGWYYIYITLSGEKKKRSYLQFLKLRIVIENSTRQIPKQVIVQLPTEKYSEF